MTKPSHASCRRWARLEDAAYALFNANEIHHQKLRAILSAANIPPPCEDRACPTCYRKPARKVTP